MTLESDTPARLRPRPGASAGRQLAVGWRHLVQLGRIAVDAGAAGIGGSLPLSPARMAAPRLLNELLHADGADSRVAGARVIDARPTGIRSVSSNCSNAVLALKWDASHPGPGGASLPDTLFVKLPSGEVLTRAFCNVLGIWRIECDFYRNLASRVPIRVPRAYAVADHRTRFVLLLEDLHGATDVELFTNPDMLAGPSIERARQCLTTLASLHAAFWGRAPEERDSLLPLARHPFLSPRSRSLNLVLNESALGPCRRKAPELLTSEVGALFLRALAHWDALVESWYREPLTLIHGDSHLGNFFADGERMGMLDWQAAQWGKGIRDVQYFLIDSLPEDVLAANEEALLAHYLAELERNGVALERAEAWEQYRAYSFQTLMTIVVSLGLGALSESDEVMLAILARSVAAVRRLRFGDWLDDLVAARAT